MVLYNWLYFGGLDNVTCQLVIGREFFLSTNAPSRLVHAHSLRVWCGKEFRKKMDFLVLDSEVVEGSGAVEGGGAFRRMK